MSARAKGAAGFTLIEILVVIVIIGILTSLVLVGVIAALNTAKASNSEAMVQAIRGALESYRVRWGDYPPTTLGDLRGMHVPNEINNGAEAMTACLSSVQRGGVLYQPPEAQAYSNVDNDRAGRNLCGWYFGDNQLREICDYFGRPLLYMHHKDYSRGPRATRLYKLGAEERDVEFKPARSAATQTFAQPDRFQVLSAGSDGVPGTPDDIVGW